jgi:hypothetical protein
MNMIKFVYLYLIVLLVIPVLPGCNNDTKNQTEFGRMLEYVPASYLEQYDIYFSDSAEICQLYGTKDYDTWEEHIEFSKTHQEFAMADLEMGSLRPDWSRFDSLFTDNRTRPGQALYEIFGLDIYAFNSVLRIKNKGAGSWIIKGPFDEELAAGRFTAGGYTKTEYGEYTYFHKFDDFAVVKEDYIGKIFSSAMNRVLIDDDTYITSPSTEYMTGILDAASGNIDSAMDNNMCRALVEISGNVTRATITTAERIILGQSGAYPFFSFDIPGNWGALEPYKMAALTVKGEGLKRFVNFALFYLDEAAAEAAGREIANRMSTYTLNTWGNEDKYIPFTDKYRPGEPTVTKCKGGYILKISCEYLNEYITETRIPNELIGINGDFFRDLLFLVPDPEIFLK